MSASANENTAKSVSNQEGEVGSHIKPQTQHAPGHQPGRQVGNEAIPESHVKTLPPGTAPADRTFAPNTSDTPGQALNPDADPAGTTSASDTFAGATSQDVHTGLGHPGQGMTSSELHHDGQGKNVKHGQGLQGVGVSGAGHYDQQGSTGKRVD